jgi:hypothetical protein
MVLRFEFWVLRFAFCVAVSREPFLGGPRSRRNSIARRINPAVGYFVSSIASFSSHALQAATGRKRERERF